LADAGATVVVADRDRQGAEQVAAELGGKGLPIEFNLNSDDSITRLFNTAAERLGGVDILVNNAGIYPKYALDTLTELQWQEMQRINTWGCFVALREASRIMRAGNRGGRIVNVSSIGGLRTAVNDQLAYNASKAALDSITQSAALELAQYNILVNSIQPGAVRPLDPRPAPSGHKPPTGPLVNPGRILLGRPALAEEIAGPILMLVSAAGAYITGQNIVIDGGFMVS
jgi:NAD(P)-dependent dehydrogenase (short-subunit alcohol dehydrogenase family)